MKTKRVGWWLSINTVIFVENTVRKEASNKRIFIFRYAPDRMFQLMQAVMIKATIRREATV